MKIISLLVTTEKLKFNFLHLFVIKIQLCYFNWTWNKTKQNAIKSWLSCKLPGWSRHSSLCIIWWDTKKEALIHKFEGLAYLHFQVKWSYYDLGGIWSETKKIINSL